MSIESTLERVAAIRQRLTDPALLLSNSPASTGGTEAPSETEPTSAGAPSSFATALAQADDGYTQTAQAQDTEAAVEPGALSSPYSTYALQTRSGTLGGAYPLSSIGGVTATDSSTPGSNPIVTIAESQLGQTEQPPGSNESPAIAQYRSATAGAVPGAPWCAYFASWAARQAGEPIGGEGQGLGSVSDIWSWAQSTGRAITNGPGVVPQPGDLIVFGSEHVGIVKDVLPNGDIQTIEGNYENKVAANVRSPTEATGYVQMG